MACSNIRYGAGVTQEVGMDFANMKATKVGVYTDKTVAQLPAMKVGLDRSSIHYEEVSVNSKMCGKP
jgi:hydroxyacid-oxoacid transhydrogenase